LNHSIYGYCRVSTEKQKLERQVENIAKSYPNAVILSESYTGTKMERPAFSKLLKRVLPGDTIVFDEVSRMSRNADEGYQLYRELYEKGVNLVFLKEPHINTAVFRDTAQAPNTGIADLDETLIKGINDYLMRLAEKQIHIAFASAQAEVDLLHRRTSEGIRVAKANGKQIGRATGSRAGVNFRETKKAKEAKDKIQKYAKCFGGNLSDKDLIKMTEINRGTYYIYKKQLKAELLRSK